MNYKFTGLKNGFIKSNNIYTNINTSFIGCDSNDNLVFFENGKRHREDGPAIIYNPTFPAFPEWWLNDDFYSHFSNYITDLRNLRVKESKTLTLEEIDYIREQWAKISWS